MARPDRAVLADAGLTVVLGGRSSPRPPTPATPGTSTGWAGPCWPPTSCPCWPCGGPRCWCWPASASPTRPGRRWSTRPTCSSRCRPWSPCSPVGAAPRPLWWRALALLTPAEMLAAAASGIWPVDLLEIGYVAVMFVSGWGLGVVLAARRGYTATWRRRRPPSRRPARSWPTGRCSRSEPASPATCMTSWPTP